MPRYILFSFLVMGWVFYEMSGGSDFQPRSAQQTAQANAEVEAPVAVASAPIQVYSINDDQAKKLVTNAAVKTKASTKTSSPADTLKENAAVIAAADNDAKLSEVRASLKQGFPLLERAQISGEIQLASLEQPAVTNDANIDPIETAVRAPVTGTADLRKITANRVNMRAGPSTSHDVLARVTRGQSVEVLGNNGDGWLRLRTLPGDRVGWIAAHLVSDPE